MLICSQEYSHFQLVLFAWPFFSFGRFYHLSICLLIRLKKGLLLLRTLSRITSIFFFSVQYDEMTCFCLISPTEITWFLGFYTWWPRYSMIWRLNVWSVTVRERDGLTYLTDVNISFITDQDGWLWENSLTSLSFPFLSWKSRHIWVICLHWNVCSFLSPFKKFAAYCVFQFVNFLFVPLPIYLY